MDSYHLGRLGSTGAPLYQRVASRLAAVRAIDNHTHLLGPGTFDPSTAAVMPLGLRSAHPDHVAALRERFGVTVGRATCARLRLYGFGKE